MKQQTRLIVYNNNNDKSKKKKRYIICSEFRTDKSGEQTAEEN